MTTNVIIHEGITAGHIWIEQFYNAEFLLAVYCLEVSRTEFLSARSSSAR